jgi:hypothetical protein
VTDATSVYADASSSAGRSRGLSDQFQDLVEFAKVVDQTTGMRRSWPLPFTLKRIGAEDADAQARKGKTRFVFTYEGLAEALREEDASFGHLIPNNLKQRFRKGKETGEFSTASGDKTFLVERWTREAYLHQRLKEGCSPEDVVGELKSTPGFTTTNMTCYRYDDFKQWKAELKGFAAGDPGFARMCEENQVDRDHANELMCQDGMQGIFWGASENGSPKRWLIRRLGWTWDDDRKLIPLPDSSYYLQKS